MMAVVRHAYPISEVPSSASGEDDRFAIFEFSGTQYKVTKVYAN